MVLTKDCVSLLIRDYSGYWVSWRLYFTPRCTRSISPRTLIRKSSYTGLLRTPLVSAPHIDPHLTSKVVSQWGEHGRWLSQKIAKELLVKGIRWLTKIYIDSSINIMHISARRDLQTILELLKPDFRKWNRFIKLLCSVIDLLLKKLWTSSPVSVPVYRDEVPELKVQTFIIHMDA